MSRVAARAPSARLVLAAMTLGDAMILVDQTAVPLALPDIMDDFDVGMQEAQWVMSASLLALAGLLVLGGRLGDLLGRRRMFLTGTTVFVAASAIGGLAPVFPMLIAARLAQGVGGALMLPLSVAIVGSAFSEEKRGRALGTMGGVAAVAGALGPTIGGTLTSALSWRAVLLVNVPLAVLCIVATLRAVPPDERPAERPSVDLLGAGLLCATLAGLVLGLGQLQGASWRSPEALVPLAVCLAAAGAFVARERAARLPLMDFALLRRHRNYLGATISQGVGGMAEMGVGVLFPLLLILNLKMDPALAGLALIPTTIPMVLGAPLAGRWYDPSGGRPPLIAGFAVLGLSGIVLALTVDGNSYLELLPGLLLFGTGLALVLTVNDPVTLDMVPAADQGQASGVSATAEQGGGAIGIAVLYALFHAAYVGQLTDIVGPEPAAQPRRDLGRAAEGRPRGRRADRPARPALRPVGGRLPPPGARGLGARVRGGVPGRRGHRRHRARRRRPVGAPAARRRGAGHRGPARGRGPGGPGLTGAGRGPAPRAASTRSRKYAREESPPGRRISRAVAGDAIRLSKAQERELRRRAAQYTRSHREVIRAKVVLLAAEGLSDAGIARRLDCADKTAGKWRRRFASEGVAGLDERPRPGRPRSFSPRRDRRGEGAGLRAAGHLGPAAVALVGG